MNPLAETSLFETLIRAFGRGFARSWQSAPAPRKEVFAPPRKRRAPRPAPAPAPVRPKPKPAAPVRPKSGHEVVRYRQGKGSFEARIVGFDRETKLITLERLSDGKRLQRPASKVYSGA